MCDCGGSTSKGPSAVAQSLDELDFERGLWFAAQYGDEERALYLLNKGCEVDERDAAGYTALHYAARNGHLALCRLLLDRGAYVDAVTHQGKATPLHRAAAVGKSEIVEHLLARKANALLKDADGKTALHRAAQNSHLDICKHLLKLEPGLKHEQDMHGHKPVEYVSSRTLIELLE